MASRKEGSGGDKGIKKAEGPSHLTTTPEKCYKCSDCDKSFTDHRLLAAHRDVFHLRMRYVTKKPSLLGRNKMGVRQTEKRGKRVVPRIDASRKKKDAKMTEIGVTVPSRPTMATLKDNNSRDQADNATTEAGVTVKVPGPTSAPPPGTIAESQEDITVKIELIPPSPDELDTIHDLASDGSEIDYGKQMKSLECPVCRTTFTYRWSMIRHVRRTHKLSHPLISLISVKCSDCPATFISRTDLIKHKRESHALQAFTCPVCSKEFSVKAYLTFHQTSQGHFSTNSAPQKSPKESDPGISPLPLLPVPSASILPGSEQERSHIEDLIRFRDEIGKTCQEFNQRRISRMNTSFFLHLGRYDPTNA